MPQIRRPDSRIFATLAQAPHCVRDSRAHHCEEAIMPDQQSNLSDTFIAQQRKRLLALHQELLGGEANRNADERDNDEQYGEEAHEFEEDAQDLAQNEINQGLHDVNDQRIADIERALQKIDEGTYGLSDESGEPIPQARLEALPEAIYTVAEQNARANRQ
jgi:DnaK suppressor protein